MSVSALNHTNLSLEPEIRRLRTLYELLAAFARATTLEHVYEAVVTGLRTATGAERAAVLTYDDEGVIRFQSWNDLSEQYRASEVLHNPWPPGAQDAAVIAIPDIQLDEKLGEIRRTLDAECIRSLACIPLILDTGVFGRVMLYYSKPHEYTEEELAVAQVIATHVALVVERKRAETAAARSQQNLQAILDASSTVIYLKDRQGRYILVNRRFEELFQHPVESVIGKTDYDLFPQEIARRFRENDRKVLDANRPLTVEEYAPQADALHTYLSIKFPIAAVDEKSAVLCGISTDITDRKQLENASLYLAAIVENSNDAIVSKDLNGIITSWNKSAERIFGYTNSEAVGNPISMLAPADRNEMPMILDRIREGKRVEHYETRRRRKDGEIIDVSLTVSPIRNASGQIIGASKIARDISDRKRAEDERALLLSHEQEARKTAELLNKVGPILAAQLDVEKLVQSVTDVATELVGAEFGWFFHNAVDQSGDSNMLSAVSGVSREAFDQFRIAGNSELFEAPFRGVVRCDDVSRDARFEDDPAFRNAGNNLTLRSYLASPLVSRSGEILGGLFFAHSAAAKFTAQHESILKGIAAQAATALDNARLFAQAQAIQSELKRSNDDLRRANQDLETFAYSASHDLQEPLRTITISAQLLERNLSSQLSSNNAQFLDNVYQGARRMETLTRDILAYATATKYAGGALERFDAGQVLTNILENLKIQIEQAGAAVTFGPMPTIEAHESRFAQVLQNLISNALKYRRKEAPRVHISAVERDNFWVFSVADNGIGIDPAYRDQIFGLFKRLHSKDQYPGSGIGLAICQRIVEQYGGTIWLDKSVSGEGSTFCFTIPVK